MGVGGGNQGAQHHPGRGCKQGCATLKETLAPSCCHASCWYAQLPLGGGVSAHASPSVPQRAQRTFQACRAMSRQASTTGVKLGSPSPCCRSHLAGLAPPAPAARPLGSTAAVTGAALLPPPNRPHSQPVALGACCCGCCGGCCCGGGCRGEGSGVGDPASKGSVASSASDSPGGRRNLQAK